MKRMDRKKKSVAKVVTGLLIGSVLGATVGWLTAPVAGEEMRRRLTGAKTGNSRRRKIASS